MGHHSETVPPNIPLVVQLGFAGSRKLVDLEAHPEVDEAEFLATVERHLGAVMRELPERLGLTKRHFLCGVSQMAIGADMVFTRVCATLEIRQRIFLPQHRDEYFKATGKSGVRDFTEAEAAEGAALLASPHIIEDRTVSLSAVRDERFTDVNLELVRVSDVLIALQRANAPGKPGGTVDFIERAKARHKPLLEITVSVRDGQPFFAEKWHPNHRPGTQENAPLLDAPGVPPVLESCTDATEENYAAALKNFTSHQARRHRGRFKWAALVIILTHFAATVCAGLGLSFPGHTRGITSWLLGGEALLLLIGFGWHLRLHHSEAARRWAMARLMSEVTRSVMAMRQVPGYLGHFFSLPMPESLRPLLRTLNVFHLAGTHGQEPGDWKRRRTAYVQKRLAAPKVGQVDYYREQHRIACTWLRVANAAFYIGSLLAILAVAWEFTAHCLCHHGEADAAEVNEFIELGPGFLAGILPVLSVAAMSLAASFDLEARKHTYAEMIRALVQQREFIEGAKSEHEFATLVLQTETRLVGENVNWFSRRTFTGVT